MVGNEAMSLKKLDRKEKKDIVYGLMLVTQVGISMMVPIILCLFIGKWIMKYVDNPLVVLFAVLFGIIVGFRNVYVLVMSTYSKDKEKEDAEYEYYKKMQDERKKRLGK